MNTPGLRLSPLPDNSVLSVELTIVPLWVFCCLCFANLYWHVLFVMCFFSFVYLAASYLSSCAWEPSWHWSFPACLARHLLFLHLWSFVSINTFLHLHACLSLLRGPTLSRPQQKMMWYHAVSDSDHFIYPKYGGLNLKSDFVESLHSVWKRVVITLHVVFVNYFVTSPLGHMKLSNATDSPLCTTDLKERLQVWMSKGNL